MALSGRRLEIRRPLAAYSSTAADKKALRPIRAVPIRLVFSAVNTRAAASTARVSIVSPHAAAWCVPGRRAGPYLAHDDQGRRPAFRERYGRRGYV